MAESEMTMGEEGRPTKRGGLLTSDRTVMVTCISDR